MYSKICDPEIMKTLLPEDFPANKLSQPEYAMVVEENVYVTMRDGIKIAMDIYRPDAPGKFPVVFVSTGYMKEFSLLPNIPVFHFVETNDISWFVKRGYILAVQDQRGSGESVEGLWDLYGENIQNDLYDCIEWLGVQPWSTGKVGMMGESLLGWAQWFAAAKQPPHLAAIVPFDAGADLYRDVVYHGGCLSQGFPSAWHFIEIRANYRLAMRGEHPDNGRWDLPWAILHHPTFDDFWKIRRADLKKINVPLFSIGFWHKTGLHLRGNTRGFEEVDAPKKLLLCHGEFEGDEMALYNSPEIRMLILRWYDHWLKGNDTGVMDEPAVTTFVHGQNEYRQENEWPLARAEYTKLYLKGGKAEIVDSLNDGCLSFEKPTIEKDSVTYSYPQADWSHFSGIGSAVMEYGNIYSYKRILTFTTEPFNEDIEVLGHSRLILYASTEQEYPPNFIDTKFFLRIWDQFPDDQHIEGYPLKGRLLTHGRMLASHSFKHDEKFETPYRPYYTHDNPQQIENSKIYKYDIEIYPFGNIFKKGHRIRLELANHDSAPFDFGGHMYGLSIGKDTIYFDKEHPSHLVLPVTGKPNPVRWEKGR